MVTFQTSCLKMQTFDNVCLHIFPKFSFYLKWDDKQFYFLYFKFFFKCWLSLSLLQIKALKYTIRKKTAKWQILLLGQEREGKENKRNF